MKKVVVERPFTLDSKVVAMQYIPDLNAVCFATLDGDIFVYEPETGKVRFWYLLQFLYTTRQANPYQH
jgi:hypothetical protein